MSENFDFKIVAYHATNRDSAIVILDKKFRAKERKNHWLGQGIYFFKYRASAVEWGKKTSYIKDPVILKSRIESNYEKNIVDLDNPKQLQSFQKFYDNQFKKSWKKSNIVYESEYSSVCACIDYLTKTNKNIYIIMYTFHKNSFDNFLGVRFEDSKLISSYIANENQICVTKNGLSALIIKDTKLEELEGSVEYV